MVVVIIIGILSTLAYSSLVELISTNRAKEVAQTIRTFTERALMDAKRQNNIVRICITGDVIIAEDPNGTTECGKGKRISSEALNKGFSYPPNVPLNGENFNTGITSTIRIGLSGIAIEGYFAVCDSRGYCGGAVKSLTENSFKAQIKRGNNTDWRAL
jgi:type II secretory pathway pseudopilin PulG